mmetsp:Transcript_53500/g.127254  ORF Transcript_53500/g.127254 Transcript_53500/m.127254 type:complete len:241 (-) Transcript_53500:218-940(-)
MGNCLCFGRESSELEDDLLSRDDSCLSGNSSHSAVNGGLPRDNARSGLRAFVLTRHAEHGILLLESSKARKGGRYFQLPGGHVDAKELHAYGPEEAPRVAAARELYEETGMDFRDRLYRLRPVDLEVLGSEGQRLHSKGRRYFELDISKTDSVHVEDIPPHSGSDVRLAAPLSMEDFTLRLSSEHTGFKFEARAAQAAKDVAKHSGGTSAVAVRVVLVSAETSNLARQASTGAGSGDEAL